LKVFTYFVEPARYTINLAHNVHKRNNIDYCFIKSTTYVENKYINNKIFLDKLSFLARINLIFKIFNQNDFIIVNGYNNYVFLLNFFLNILSIKKKFIAIESDSQYTIKRNILLRFIKWIYLNIIFRNKYILGFPGGSNNHKKLFYSYGMNKKRIFLMPMMVNNSNFFLKHKQKPVNFTFLFVGRIELEKGIESLIKIFIKHFKNTNVILKIVGSGSKLELLKKQYNFNQIIFLGKLTDRKLINEYHNASCFVLPSVFEPWGLVVNEALSSSLPVITTKEVGASYDLIMNKNTGFICNNMREFGFKMKYLYENQDQVMKLSKNADNLMRNKWNYQFYEQCLRDVILKIRNEAN